MHKFCSLFMLIGRIMLALIFVFGGVSKFMDPDSSLAYMQAKGVGNASLLLYVAALMELIGGVMLLVGYRTRLGALILILFLIPVSCMMHNFWTLEGAAQQQEMIRFFANVSIVGGLLYVFSFGGGSYGFDADCCPEKNQ